MLNGLRHRILGNYEISRKSQNFIELLPSAQSSCRIRFLPKFVSSSKNPLKNENWTFPVEFISNILWMILALAELHKNDFKYENLLMSLTVVFQWIAKSNWFQKSCQSIISSWNCEISYFESFVLTLLLDCGTVTRALKVLVPWLDLKRHRFIFTISSLILSSPTKIFSNSV